MSQVAVVDDDYRILESLDELLAAAGYDVLLFDSGESLLKADCIQYIECVISDVSMPRMNGWQLLDAIRAARPGLPAIMISGREEEENFPSALRCRSRFFRKPFKGADLLREVAALIASQDDEPL